ncbi:MAG TPA: aspartate aminotransferase family protein [Candidatus Paceibacterota bacterium]|nr:aspartate aminotransferase family protein [Verrucomicrobiota bacterium]HRY50608.1 aspartate aminotransferase family protein [Candidatus Paceibacterota bacterium]HRZ99534.1 aspartate aminotransferase family protein [Candidatus Paceibacterota bacterium]
MTTSGYCDGKARQPGSATRRVLELLKRYECRNTTQIAAGGSWPVVWERARGVTVQDADGRSYMDLTAAFGVAAAGHANPRVVRAGRDQMLKLAHAMGDVHPHGLKARLARELSRITFERWHKSGRKSPASSEHGKTLFCNSGFEAVEAALKTARLATGKSRILAFTGAYHGLGYGALNATHREFFRAPFLSQLKAFADFIPFPASTDDLSRVEKALRQRLRRGTVGAILVEPVQGRGGIRVPPPEFLPRLREWCDHDAALLIVDEVYTGFGRTGRWFACEHTNTIPDLICLGKALTGGFPLSACVGRADLMDAAWPVSEGEAIHTSTFLGHPVGCAMALAQIEEIRRRDLVAQSAKLGAWFLSELEKLEVPAGCRGMARGLGLMVGWELRRRDNRPATAVVLAIVQKMLGRGYLVLPEGEQSEVLGFTPPLTISKAQLRRTLVVLKEIVDSDLCCDLI